MPIQTSDPVTVFRELLNAMIGCIFATGRSTAPAGFLLCDGAAVLRADYADLFTAVGTAYGAGNGTTTFNVPDLRGRAPVGVDGTAGRLTANDARGNAGGAQDRTLTIPELPSHAHTTEAAGAHSHGGATTATDINHAHGSGGAAFGLNYYWTGNQGPVGIGVAAGLGRLAQTLDSSGAVGLASTTALMDRANSHGHYINTDGGHGHTINPTGTGSPSSVMQPYQVVNFIIRF